MGVRRDEGVAIHIGPEPCAGIREGVGEASVGERAGPRTTCWPARAADRRGLHSGASTSGHAEMICNKSFMMSSKWYGSLGLASNVKCS